jgi:predicted nucleic-acid-binding Zn-ribbon protein
MNMSDIIRCPKCRSEQLHISEKGFSLGKAAAGVITLGAIGALAGLHGKTKIQLNCLKCGHNWAPQYDNLKTSNYSISQSAGSSLSTATGQYSPTRPLTKKEQNEWIRLFIGITIVNIIVATIMIAIEII